MIIISLKKVTSIDISNNKTNLYFICASREVNTESAFILCPY